MQQSKPEPPGHVFFRGPSKWILPFPLGFPSKPPKKGVSATKEPQKGGVAFGFPSKPPNEERGGGLGSFKIAKKWASPKKAPPKNVAFLFKTFKTTQKSRGVHRPKKRRRRAFRSGGFFFSRLGRRRGLELLHLLDVLSRVDWPRFEGKNTPPGIISLGCPRCFFLSF